MAMVNLFPSLLLLLALPCIVLSTRNRRSLLRREADNLFDHDSLPTTTAEESKPAAKKKSNASGKKKSKKGKSKKSGITLSILETISPAPNQASFGKEVVAIRDNGNKRLVASSQLQANLYTLGASPPIVPLTPSPSPITKLATYKNWLAVSSATDSDATGVVYLYDVNDLTQQYPPIRGVKPGTFLGKSLAIMEDETNSMPIIAVGSNGLVSTYKLESNQWMPLGGGCILPENQTTLSITGDSFGSSLNFGKDSSSNKILLYISAPTNDKNWKQKKVGSLLVYRLVGDVWTKMYQQVGSHRNGLFGYSVRAHENYVLVSAPCDKKGKGTLSLLWTVNNKAGNQFKRFINKIQPYGKYQFLFGCSLDFVKIDDRRYIGVGSWNKKNNTTGVVQVLQQYKRKATQIAQFLEEKNQETCSVGTSLALMESSNDVPCVIAGGPFCDQVYVLGKQA